MLREWYSLIAISFVSKFVIIISVVTVNSLVTLIKLASQNAHFARVLRRFAAENALFVQDLSNLRSA